MKRRSGFTLLELIIVITIIGILVTLTMAAAQRARAAALETERLNWHYQRKLGATVSREAPIRILFIGNSYTFFNNLPDMLRTLAQSSGSKPELIVDTQTVGGARLKTHWDAGTALQKIRAEKWDFVVLQEQSQTPLKQYGRDQFFYPYARKFAAEIKAQNAIPLFFMTWSRPDTPGPQKLWTESYVGITKEVRGEVAPAGMAWETVRNTLPQLQLYHDTGGHPSKVGTYLAACTFWATIYDRSPVGLPSSFQYADGSVNLGAGTAKVIQQAAWQALKKVKPKVRPEWLR